MDLAINMFGFLAAMKRCGSLFPTGSLLSHASFYKEIDSPLPRMGFVISRIKCNVFKIFLQKGVAVLCRHLEFSEGG